MKSLLVVELFFICASILSLPAEQVTWASPPAPSKRIYYPNTVVAPEQRDHFYFPNYSHYIFRLSEKPEDQFQLLVFENDDDFTTPQTHTPEGQKILSLARRAKDATWEEFERVMAKAYPGEYSKERIQKMYDHDRLFGNHMARLMILEMGPIETARVLATLKLTVEGDDGNGLDVEQTIPDLHIPRDWHFEIPRGESEKGQILALRPELVGGIVQFSGFMNRGPKELGSIIHFAATHLALQGMAGHPDILLNQHLKENFRSVTHGLIKPMGREYLHVTQTVVYCAKFQADYYKRFMGFEPINGWDPEPSGEYVLMQSMESFKKVAEKNIFWRKGRQLIERYGFWKVFEDDPEHKQAMRWKIDSEGFVGTWPRSPVNETFLLREPRLDALVNLSMPGTSHGIFGDNLCSRIYSRSPSRSAVP